jgi:uncharacterized protein YjbI with pentapeptide repeats
MTEKGVRPARDAKGDVWKQYWAKQDMPWRTEPDISLERKRFLTKRRGPWAFRFWVTYPFKDVKLTRADVEWLLATHRDPWHRDITGPLDWDDPKHHRREGLDLRGADLQGVNLQYLPLAGVQGGLHGEELVMSDFDNVGSMLNYDNPDAPFYGMNASEISYHLCDQAAVHLEGASLGNAHLEHAHLYQAHLEGAKLPQANLDHVDLGDAHLEGAYFARATLEGAWLYRVTAEGADFGGARLSGASFNSAWLLGANFRDASLTRTDFSSAHLSGACLQDAHLEGAKFEKAYLAGVTLSTGRLQRIRKWNKSESWRPRVFWESHEFPATIPPAELQRAHFDADTRLDHAELGSKKYGGVYLADVRWGGANLAVADWALVGCVGEECDARTRNDAAGKQKDSETRVNEHLVAVRANRQLSVALREQGLNEDADRFAYAAHVCKRRLLREQALFRRTPTDPFLDEMFGVKPPTVRQRLHTLSQRMQTLGQWVVSWFFWCLAGYGYRPFRSLLAYVGVITFFALTYHHLGSVTHHALGWREAFVVSMTAFHGRGFFPDQFKPGDPQALAAAAEALVGLIIEVSFIATFTQRFFAR